MAVENALFVGGLNNAYPAGSEFVAQGDDHLRLVKTVLLNTFPGVVRAIDAQLIPMSTYPGSPDTTTVYAAIYANTDAIAAINAYLLTNPLGDALRANNNLSDVANAATARSNLNAQEAGVSLLIANNLNDLADVVAARSNLGVASSAETLLSANNLLDVADPAVARTNLGVPATSAVLLRADNLASLTNAATARSNLGVSATADVLLRANNLSDIVSAAAARANLGVSSTAQMDAAIAVAVADALASVTSGVFIPKTADFTFGIREDVRVDVTAGPVIATLEGTPEAGAFHVIVISGGDVTTNNITLTGPDTINGAASVTIDVEGYHFVFYNGTDWTYFNLNSSASLASHIAAANPHSQYLLITDIGTYLPNWVQANNGANFAIAPTANGADSIAIGDNTTTGTNLRCIAIGKSCGVAGNDQVVIGPNSYSTYALSGLLVGPNNVNTTNSTLVGRNLTTTSGGQGSTLVGAGNINRSSGGSGTYHSVLVGESCEVVAGNISGGVAIGRSVKIGSSGAIGIGGYNYTVSAGAVTINAGTNGGNVSASYAVNIGSNCDSLGTGAVRLGGGNLVSGYGAPGNYSIAVGYNSNVEGINSVAIGSSVDNQEANTAVIGGVLGVATFGINSVNFPNYESSTAERTRSGLISCKAGTVTGDGAYVLRISTMAANQFAALEVVVISREAATGDICVRRCTLNVVSDASKVITIVGSPVIGVAEKTGTMETAVSFTTDGPGTTLQLSITGEVAKTIKTTAYCKFVGTNT